MFIELALRLTLLTINVNSVPALKLLLYFNFVSLSELSLQKNGIQAVPHMLAVNDHYIVQDENSKSRSSTARRSARKSSRKSSRKSIASWQHSVDVSTAIQNQTPQTMDVEEFSKGPSPGSVCSDYQQESQRVSNETGDNGKVI